MTTAMIVEKRGVSGVTERHRRSPLLERPSLQRRPLLSSNTSRGDGGGVSSSARSSTSFVNAPVQQPFVGGGSVPPVAGVVDILSSQSSPSRAFAGGNCGERRKGLLNTPTKAKREVTEKKSPDDMCVSCKSKLRLNERGEYCCSACGKIQLRSVVSINSLIGPPLLRQRAGSAEVDDSMTHRSNGDSGNVRKLPALLDLPSNMYRMGATQSSPIPLISFPNNAAALISTTSSTPTSLFALMTASHRVLYPPTVSEEKQTQPQSLFANTLPHSNGSRPKKQSKLDRSLGRHHPYPRADYVRGADLKLASPSKNGASSSSSKRARSTTVNKGTVTDVSQESDLPWLYQQRADIDRRIAQLQEKSGTSDRDIQGLESVTYVSGYYCHVCRKLLRGDYSTKLAHCRDQTHLTNFESSRKDDSGNQQDADSLFKYYEEKYECIAFDGDDDDGAVTDQSGNGLDSSLTRAQREARSEATLLEEISADSARNDAPEEEIDEDALLFGDVSSCAVGVQSMSDDEEDADAEETPHRERFDRTKISRLS